MGETGCGICAGTYAVVAAVDAKNQRVTVAVPCAACVGGLSPGAEASWPPRYVGLCSMRSPLQRL